MAQVEAQTTMQVERDKMQTQAQVDTHRQQVEAEQQSMKAEKEAQLAQYMAGLDAQKEAARMLHEREMKQLEIDANERKLVMDGQIKLQLAERSAQHASEQAEKTAKVEKPKAEKPDDSIKVMTDMHGKTLKAIETLAQTMSKPKTIVRGPDGKMIGVQ
jgi:hypothetical protein